MREILFRGKRLDNGRWVQGSVFTRANQAYIFPVPIITCKVEVSPATVGQYTGLTNNGKKIFEGDIVKAQDNIFGSPFCNGITGKIVYEETAFFIEPKDPVKTQWLFNECAVYEVIGNIHDNPELLGERKDHDSNF